jgi:hypothetical protein
MSKQNGDMKRAREQQRRDQYHQGNLSAAGQSDQKPQQLKYIAEIDDIPTDDDDTLAKTLQSKIFSTSNLNTDERRSHEWETQILNLLDTVAAPRKKGMHGAFAAWAYDDESADIDPMVPEKRQEREAQLQVARLELAQSEDMTLVKEGLRDVRESHVNDGEQMSTTSGGIMGKLGLR